MTEVAKKWLREQARFNGIFEAGEEGDGREGSDNDSAIGQGGEKKDRKPYKDGRFAEKIPLRDVTLYTECKTYIAEACDSGCDGKEKRLFEEDLSRFMGLKYGYSLNRVGNPILTSPPLKQ